MNQNREEKLFHAQIHLKNGTLPVFVASDTGEFPKKFVPHGGGMEISVKVQCNKTGKKTYFTHSDLSAAWRRNED